MATKSVDFQVVASTLQPMIGTQRWLALFIIATCLAQDGRLSAQRLYQPENIPTRGRGPERRAKTAVFGQMFLQRVRQCRVLAKDKQ
jgi:hypothetical protein